jgi:hypothetical protein
MRHPPGLFQAAGNSFSRGCPSEHPIVLASGKVYGTLCCFSQAADESLTAKDLQKLECVARITARRIDIKQAQQLQPAEEKRTPCGPASPGKL